MKKALLIGINYYSTPEVQLSGCIDDVNNIRSVLIDAYDYDITNIVTLRDDELRAQYLPTRDNIINNLKALVSQSASLKEIWVHYSGHGSQIQDTNGDEQSGLDSILVPCDYQQRGFIIDDELLNIIKNIKCRAILAFDSCHSGTVCDLPWSFEYKNVNSYIKTKNNNVVIQNPNIYMFSGCKDNQTSDDAYSNEGQQYVGAFTNALINAMRINRHNVDCMILYRDLCDYLKANKFSQIPIFSSSNPSPNYKFVRATQITNANTMSKQIATNANLSIRSIMRSIINS
jgi:hypothetical protein